MVRESRFRAVFSLCLFVVCPVARTSDANPLGYGRGTGGRNRSATFGSIQVGPSSQGPTLGAYRHRPRLFLPMRRTRASGRPGLRMPRGANLAKKYQEAVSFAAGCACSARASCRKIGICEESSRVLAVNFALRGPRSPPLSTAPQSSRPK